LQWIFELLQAPYALERGLSGKRSLYNKSLGCSADCDGAHQVSQLKIIELDLLQIKWDFMTVADFLMYGL